MKNLSQNSQSLGLDLKQRPPKYEAGNKCGVKFDGIICLCAHVC
jgi:hypothetical protein